MEEYKVNFLSKVSDYFWSQTQKDGRLVCSKHKVEHTGKNVYSIFIDSKLSQVTKDDKYFERARLRALRTVENLRLDPDYEYWIFYPGRLNPRNMANSIIDGGACVDSLVHFLEVFGGKIEREEKENILDAIFKHCDTYLKTTSVEKDITNQRLWGATGLASGYRLFQEPSWKKALMESLERSFAEGKSDGSFFYDPNYRDYGIFQGIYDVTTYYHSRCIAFAFHILEELNLVNQHLDKLTKGLDFLIGMYQPNGVKNLCLETKRWYWKSTYEVASHAFDIYALIKGFEWTNTEVYEVYARKAFRNILGHQLPDGGITSHHGKQDNFQCRIFWNGHLAWLAKVLERVEPETTEVPLDSSVFYQVFPDTQLVKFENANISAILRGNKAPMNVGWGCPVGGGSLLYFGSGRNAWRNELTVREWTPYIDNNFIFIISVRDEILNLVKLAKQFFKVNKKDLGRGRAFFSFGFFKDTLLRFLSEVRSVSTTHWATECEMLKTERECKFTLHPSRRDGNSILNGVTVERSYRFEDEELLVEENVHCQARGNIRLTRYKLNQICRGVSVETNCKLKRQGELLSFKPYKDIPPKIVIKYKLK
ncbi:hypothetical protein ACFLWB_00125 [Chloroflexota bacterium]